MIIGSKIIKFDTLSSTNTMAAMLLQNDPPKEGLVISAQSQTDGKGQGNNTWIDEPGSNLLFSIILYPESILPEDLQYINIFVSLGICDFLDEFCQGSKIKLPNDIYIGKKKIAGILIENSLLDNTLKSSITGIGFNLNQTGFPEDIPHPVSLKMLTGDEYDRDDCLTRLLASLDSRYKELLYGNREKLKSEFQNRLM